MNPWFALITAVAVLAAYMGGRAAIRRAARLRASQRPFPDEWRDIVRRNLPLYPRLPGKLRDDLHRGISLFLAEKVFEGCGGLEITDEIRVTIAAQACMLLLNRTDHGYPGLCTVLVYPSTYVVDGRSRFGPDAERSVRLGESWASGTVVLAWNSVKRGAANFCDGDNVAMHEFAHQLDQEDGTADGAPILDRCSAYASWGRVLSSEYERLQRKVGSHETSVLSSYGATDPAEFFAVATEAFFEKPRQMQKKHPELYEELSGFYKVSPVDWV